MKIKQNSILKKAGVALLLIGVITMGSSSIYSAASTEDKKIKKQISQMTIEEKIGQMMLISFRSWKLQDMQEPEELEVMNDEIAAMIAEYHIGNIILFSENTKEIEKTVQLTSAMQNAAVDSGNVPLIIGIDQEGGKITRLGQGTCLPGNMAIGATGNVKYAYDCGNIIGAELSALGINCTFAPVADINDNPQNPIINLRSFGSEPNQVADMVINMQDGIHSKHVIACVKHFPGHGSTDTDTHTGLAVVNKSKKEWSSCEKVPFEAAIDHGIDIVMTAHIQFPNLDDTMVTSKLNGEKICLPATLSKKIVDGVLRKEMNYDGVVVTDALNMQAIADHFGETEAVVMAMKAGVDMMCYPTEISCLEDKTKLDAIYQAIKDAISRGELSEKSIDKSVERILRLKAEKGILETKQYSSSTDKQSANALQIVGCKEHRVKERNMAEAAVTLYPTAGRKLSKPQEGDIVLFIVPYENETFSIKFAINRLLEEKDIPNINVDTYFYTKENEISRILKEKIDQADYIAVASEMHAITENSSSKWLSLMPAKVLDYIEEIEKQENVVLMSFGLPYDAVKFSDYPVYIAYNCVGMSEEDAKSGVISSKYGPNIPAVVGAVLGTFRPTGKLPIALEGESSMSDVDVKNKKN